LSSNNSPLRRLIGGKSLELKWTSFKELRRSKQDKGQGRRMLKKVIETRLISLLKATKEEGRKILRL
jgi:hypothetical protein